ncbi:hypothetical protein J3E68DRAFT_410656 [Trichoderma sp. SZMC 28012]
MVVYSELTKESNPGLPLGVVLLALWNITSCTSFCIHLPCSFRVPGHHTTPGLRGVVILGLTRRNDTRFLRGWFGTAIAPSQCTLNLTRKRSQDETVDDNVVAAAGQGCTIT